jgi:hypothetical protein
LSTARRAVSQRTRARWLPRGFAIAAGNPRVGELIHYLLMNLPPAHPFTTGLTEADGTIGPRPIAPSLRGPSAPSRPAIRAVRNNN